MEESIIKRLELLEQKANILNDLRKIVDEHLDLVDSRIIILNNKIDNIIGLIK